MGRSDEGRQYPSRAAAASSTASTSPGARSSAPGPPRRRVFGGCGRRRRQAARGGGGNGEALTNTRLGFKAALENPTETAFAFVLQVVEDGAQADGAVLLARSVRDLYADHPLFQVSRELMMGPCCPSNVDTGGVPTHAPDACGPRTERLRGLVLRKGTRRQGAPEARTIGLREATRHQDEHQQQHQPTASQLMGGGSIG